VPCLFATGFVILGTGCGSEDNSVTTQSGTPSSNSASAGSSSSPSVSANAHESVSAHEGANPVSENAAEEGSEPVLPSQGAEVLTAEDHFLCVRATDKREIYRNHESSEGPSRLEETCKENAKNVCKAKGYETLITFEVQPLDAGISSIQYFIINTEPAFYKVLTVRVTPEEDIIPANDSEPFFTTDIFSSVKCADPFTLPLESRNEIFSENETPASADSPVGGTPRWIDSMKESIKGWFKH
jgi:hypothetical protein